ncbi:MAG: hypothetical protein ACI4JV_02705 [Ruminiclostridium sp.]
MEKQRLEKVMELYHNRYNAILESIKPSIQSNGFAEHNQTVNFVSAYELISCNKKEAVSSWYEFQILNGKRSDNRIDGIIINHSAKEIYLIEAKRISRNKIRKKKTELIDDYCRIMQLDKTSRFTEVLKDENVSDYSIYGILLFDIWTENKAEKELYHKWNEFCNSKNPTREEFIKVLDADTMILKPEYISGEIFPMIKEVQCLRSKEYSYYLCAFVWDTECKKIG